MKYSTDTLFFTDELDGVLECRATRSANSITLLLCKNGSLDVELNRRRVHIGPRDLYMRIPSFRIELGNLSYTDDFEFYLLAIHESVFEELMFEHMRVEPRWWQKLQYLRESPVFALSDWSYSICMLYVQMLDKQLAVPQTDMRRQILRGIARVATMDIFYYMDRVLETVPDFDERRDSVNQSDYTFHRFVHMLQTNPHHREVQWFAEQLSITPKYLSEICKQRSGKSASEWIADVTVSELKQRLRSTTHSIHEVAQEMEFPNTSFFCQYTKKHTGLTPHQLRKSLRN